MINSRTIDLGCYADIGGPEATPKTGIGMAGHIDGPLYYETLGKSGPVMAFVHRTQWTSRAGSSRWRSCPQYRCIAIDLPGYGKSPKARAGLAMQDIAQACWEAIDDAYPGERALWSAAPSAHRC